MDLTVEILMSVQRKPTNATGNPSVETGMGHMSAVVTQDIMAAVSTVQVMVRVKELCVI